MTQPISGVTFPASRSARRRGRKTEGLRKALIRRGASRVEGQCSGEIGQLHGKRKPSVTTFLLFHSSAFPFRLSTPPVILSMVLLSHAALMAAACVNVCVSLLVFVLLFVYECVHAGLPFCHPCVQFPETSFQPLLRSATASTEPSFQHEQKVRMRRGKAPASILYPLLGCSCP